MIASIGNFQKRPINGAGKSISNCLGPGQRMTGNGTLGDERCALGRIAVMLAQLYTSTKTHR